MTAHGKRIGKKITFYDIEQKVGNVLKTKTTKMIVDFFAEESGCIKSFPIKNGQIRVTTIFLSVKIIMFARFP